MNKVLECVNITQAFHTVEMPYRQQEESLEMKPAWKNQMHRRKRSLWKRTILSDISRLEKDLSTIDAWFTWRRKKDKTKQELIDLKYGLRRKGFTLVMEEL